MKVLLDECLPRKLKSGLTDHECLTVPEAGLAGKKNGSLIDIAESTGFEIFVTMDKGLEYEQTIAGRNIAILVLRAKSTGARHLTSYFQTPTRARRVQDDDSLIGTHQEGCLGWAL